MPRAGPAQGEIPGASARGRLCEDRHRFPGGSAMPDPSPRTRLAAMLAEFTPEISRRARAVMRHLGALVPGAVRLVYDNYYALVIGYGPTERPSEAVLSVLVAPNHVTLCFLNGKALRDPKKLLRGTGNRVRNIRLPEAAT